MPLQSASFALPCAYLPPNPARSCCAAGTRQQKPRSLDPLASFLSVPCTSNKSIASENSQKGIAPPSPPPSLEKRKKRAFPAQLANILEYAVPARVRSRPGSVVSRVVRSSVLFPVRRVVAKRVVGHGEVISYNLAFSSSVKLCSAVRNLHSCSADRR